jgi:hypothetical protein
LLVFQLAQERLCLFTMNLFLPRLVHALLEQSGGEDLEHSTALFRALFVGECLQGVS